jgi:hypothetical protein
MNRHPHLAHAHAHYPPTWALGGLTSASKGPVLPVSVCTQPTFNSAAAGCCTCLPYRAPMFPSSPTGCHIVIDYINLLLPAPLLFRLPPPFGFAPSPTPKVSKRAIITCGWPSCLFPSTSSTTTSYHHSIRRAADQGIPHVLFFMIRC